MNNARPILAIAFAFTAFLLWDAWQRDYAAPPPADRASPVQPQTADAPPALPAATEDASIPSLDAAPAANGLAAPVAASPATTTDFVETVRVETDVLVVDISLRGGNLVNAWLKAYPVDTDSPDQPVQLLDNGIEFYVAQSGLAAVDGAAPDHLALYEAVQSRYTLEEDSLVVPLTWQRGGIAVTKRLTFTQGSYLIGVEHEISNGSAAPLAMAPYFQFQRVEINRDRGWSFTNPEQYSFTGGGVYDAQEKYEKIDFADFRKQRDRTARDGWIAMVQHYFVSAWVPQQPSEMAIATGLNTANGLPRHIIRMLGAQQTVAPGAMVSVPAQLWVGPKLQDELDALTDGLELTVDYGMLTVFSKMLFWVLEKIHAVVGNWGWAIVLLTVLIKLIFYPLSSAQYRSMAKMRELAPKMKELQHRYKDDRAKLNQAVMKLYKDHKANPLGGCLPLLVQIPVFIALYWVLLESVELRQAPFMLWIDDLSKRDPYFVLPALNGIAMYLTTKLSPPAPGMDPMQQKILQAMPVIFAFVFAFFQAGLVLYWAVNSILSLLQQYVIMKRMGQA